MKMRRGCIRQLQSARVSVANEKFEIISKTQTYVGSIFLTSDQSLAINNRKIAMR